MSERDMTRQGVGVRVRRKEDARHLHGRGSFVSDMMLPGQSEVAFLRSPIAHGRIRRIVKPPGTEAQVFIRADLDGVAAIVAPTTLPGYKLSECIRWRTTRCASWAKRSRCAWRRRAPRPRTSPRDRDRVRRASRAGRCPCGRAEPSVRIHEAWSDNSFLTLNYESGFEAKAKGAPVVIRREVALARQAMVPMEGKAVLAHWDDRSDQLVVYASTQVPHIIRVGLAQFLGIDQGQVRVISPDVGGGFGYKVRRAARGALRRLARAQVPPAVPLCRGSPRAPGGGRQLAAAPLPAHRARRRARPAPGARCRGHDRRRRLFGLAVHGRARAGTGDRQPAGALRFPRLPLPDPLRGHQQARLSCRIGAWRAPAFASPWS